MVYPNLSLLRLESTDRWDATRKMRCVKTSRKRQGREAFLASPILDEMLTVERGRLGRDYVRQDLISR